MDPRNLIIIGSGPAGYTAAIYAARADLAPLLFEGREPGGQLIQTTEVENFPGFPKGVQGQDLMAAMKEQALRFKTEIVGEQVTAVDFSQRPFKVVAGEKEYFAKAVIISTGASARRLGLESERALYGKGVSACATCDGFFFRNKIVAVVGGGDAAMEEANFLTKFASKAYVIHRRDAFNASKAMQERTFANPKIEVIWSSAVEEVLGVDVGHVTGVRLKNAVTGETRDLPVDGMFAAIGHEPNTALFNGQLQIEKGYVITVPGTSKTNVPGVFAAGDVQDWKYRQAITAAGSGCMAALDAEKYLAE